VKRFVHPPKDYEKWAAICLGIIRHYNEGWANGARHNIRYWEIWNEPENKPVMWSGSDEDYYRLYGVAVRAIKKEFPDLKVGGPGVGYSGDFKNGVFRPGAFVTNFLAYCRREALPLDFFSWHCYTANPGEIIARAHGIRRLLDGYGFTKTESHLNEWNFLPGNTWKPLSKSSAPEVRQRFAEEMSGLGGAVFIATTLLELQDAPVDVGNLFHGELGSFGLFNEFGVPLKNYHAMRAFAALLETPRRVKAYGAVPGRLAVDAGIHTNETAATVLISNFAEARSDMSIMITNLPWNGGTIVETRRLTADENLDVVTRETNVVGELRLNVQLKAPALALIQLKTKR
jgi:hypothetical protein